MSTVEREYEYGRVTSVSIVTLGSALSADTAAGATTLTVDDAADFDEYGGQLIIGGVVYVYTSVDDDAGTITLASTLGLDAIEGAEVAVYDPVYLTAATEKMAKVALHGSSGNTDALEATVALHLTDKLSEGIRGISGESVLLEVDGEEWRIVDLLGLADPASGVDPDDPTAQASPVQAEQDQSDATAAIAGVTQSIILKHTPILNSEHVYWNGVYQRGSEWTRYGNIVVIPDPDGMTQVGDEFTCEYLYTPGTDWSDLGSGIELIGEVWYDLDVATHPGTGFDLALPSGTQAGDLLCMVVSSWVEPAFSADPRFYMSQIVDDSIVPGGDITRTCMVAVGREDGTAGTVHVELGLSAWRGVGIVAFRGVTIASAVGFIQVGSAGTVPDPPSPATRYIAITATISGTVGDNIDIPAAPVGAWATALRDRADKAAGMVCYTPDPAPEVASQAGGIEFDPGVGGSTGYCQGIVLGIR